MNNVQISGKRAHSNAQVTLRVRLVTMTTEDASDSLYNLQVTSLPVLYNDFTPTQYLFTMHITKHSSSEVPLSVFNGLKLLPVPVYVMYLSSSSIGNSDNVHIDSNHRKQFLVRLPLFHP